MTLTTLKETVSNSNLTGNASSNNMEFLTDQDFGTCVHFKNSNGSNVFSCTYNSSTFPSLYSVISDATKPMSMVVIGDYSEMTNAGSYGRWGFLCSYGVKQLSAWTTSYGVNTAFPFFDFGSNGFLNARVGAYQKFISGNISIMYLGCDSGNVSYTDSNGQYATTNSYYRVSGSTSNGTLRFGLPLEGSYMVPAGVKFYGITMYDNMLTEAQLNYLISIKRTNYQ